MHHQNLEKSAALLAKCVNAHHLICPGLLDRGHLEGDAAMDLALNGKHGEAQLWQFNRYEYIIIPTSTLQLITMRICTSTWKNVQFISGVTRSPAIPSQDARKEGKPITSSSLQLKTIRHKTKNILSAFFVCDAIIDAD